MGYTESAVIEKIKNEIEEYPVLLCRIHPLRNENKFDSLAVSVQHVERMLQREKEIGIWA